MGLEVSGTIDSLVYCRTGKFLLSGTGRRD